MAFWERPSDPGPRPIAAVLRALERSIKRLGGDILPDPCRPRDIHYLGPGNQTMGPAATCGCGGQTRAVLPYADAINDQPLFATFCVICDSASSWPRLRAANV